MRTGELSNESFESLRLSSVEPPGFRSMVHEEEALRLLPMLLMRRTELPTRAEALLRSEVPFLRMAS